MAFTLQFKNETAFEDAVITNLTERHGWSPKILEYPTEEQLIDNWVSIVFENNNSRDKLNGIPLSDSEKQTLIGELAQKSSPYQVHRWLQGEEVPLKRDNPSDALNHNKLVYLKIFDPREVGGGDSTYQIARQPKFMRYDPVDRDRRGDLMLLIWGLPLIHLELKNSNHPYTEAINQLQKYTGQSVFNGIFNAVQVFVALTPEEMRYFARPADADSFNSDFFFNWTDFDNEPYAGWQDNIATFLGIPFAHRLIGDYMIADRGDRTLKVLRPYQIHAVAQITHKLRQINKLGSEEWTRNTQKGGYIWHTTGSGKTMTSFKSAALLSRDKLADKVVFVLDRLELSDQSMIEYSNFSDESVELSEPRSTIELAEYLKDPSRTLILTSLQKLGILSNEESDYTEADFNKIRSQRLVFVVDEAHRSTFGSMFTALKNRFPQAIFIGYTGTPIYDENRRKDSITYDLFGEELHKYTIHHGLRDGNVLRFETKAVSTFDDDELRSQVALEKARASSILEIMQNPDKRVIYDKYNDPKKVPWVSCIDENGSTTRGIEDLAGTATWEREEHRVQVVEYIKKHWVERSRGGNLHALLAANSVLEAISYYRLFKERTELKVTAVFTDADENNADAFVRDRGLREILTDYNELFGQNFSRDRLGDFKADVSNRLAHKEGYSRIDSEPDEQLDLVIVVDQLLTGYDSKWLNTLYFDRVFTYDRLVQAFSRTNRILNSHLKPFGSIVYFRKVHTMERNIIEAFDLYSGNKLEGIFADTLPTTLRRINELFIDIARIFADSRIINFDRLPPDKSSRRKFAIAFAQLAQKVEAAHIQGFTWDESEYPDEDLSTDPASKIKALIDKHTYSVLLARYAELGETSGDGDDDDTGEPPVPLNLNCMAMARESKHIDLEYLDQKFEHYRNLLRSDQVDHEARAELLSQVQMAYAALSFEDQNVAEMILTDLSTGKIELYEKKTFRDYLNEYKADARSLKVKSLHEATGISIEHIERVLTVSDGTEATLMTFGRFKDLMDAIDDKRFTEWLKEVKGLELTQYDRQEAAEYLLRDFFLSGGINAEDWDSSEFD